MSQSQREAATLGAEERALGMAQPITRRDFLNAAVIGAGAALLNQPAPLAAARALVRQERDDPWTGFGGVGDYATSNGNTLEVLRVAHAMRDGRYDTQLPGTTDTGETYDLIVVGGGLAGLGAAHHFRTLAGTTARCLVLENHPIFGGEAKRNEFVVRGQRLMAPQGSNDFTLPSAGDGWRRALWVELGLPDRYEYQRLSRDRKPMQFARDNYVFQLWGDDFESHGFFFDQPHEHWVRNPWGHGLAGTPWPDAVRRDLLRWRSAMARPYEGEHWTRWLDTMTYEQYLVRELGLRVEAARYADAVLAGSLGLGSDVLSAYAAFEVGLPGFQGFFPGGTPGLGNRLAEMGEVHAFPGGNDAIGRHILKALNPDAITGGPRFDDIMNGRVRFGALDSRGSRTRFRLGATAVRVEHERRPGPGRRVTVIYVKGGRAYRVRARAVVMASGSWSAKHVVRDLPEDCYAAMRAFPRSPMLVANVALTNWRFLYQLGFTACSWRGGFGFCCNIRSTMLVGAYRPALDPDLPTVLTFYVPFHRPGLPLAVQGHRGRAELLATSYREYEGAIRAQMVKLFGPAGFDPARDIAGIILNRWGHAYVNPAPGFYFGADGRPAPREVLRRPFGAVAFANSELNGHQSWHGAIGEGWRAVEQLVNA